MRNWKGNSIVTLFVFISFIHLLQGEVTLRVLLRPPIVTLECLVINIKEKASVIMMCPNDVMCFQNCTPLCKKNCSISARCFMSVTNNGLMFKYIFDTTYASNQGEWTCHFGHQQSSTVIFFNETDQRIISSESIKKQISTATTINETTYRGNMISKYYRILTTTKSESSPPRPTFVIVLIVLLVLSLCLNIALIIRSVLYKTSSDKSPVSINSEKSCIIKLCAKLFFVEDLFQKKSESRTKSLLENKELLQRQFSNNIYECTPTSHVPPSFMLDNCAFIGTPTNQKLFPASMYDRSMSCLCQPTNQNQFRNIRPNTLLPKSPISSQLRHIYGRHDGVGALVYDDVAEPSIGYVPLSYFNQINRPSQYMSMSGDICGSAMSMNNLATTGFRMTTHEDVDGTMNGQCGDETLLKDAISSRVELSKEMINHADTLLKKADSLLNDKDSNQNNRN